MPSSEKPTRLLRQSSVLERVPLSKTELYRRVKAGTFPAPIKLGAGANARAVAWTESSIDDWIASLSKGDAK